MYILKKENSAAPKGFWLESRPAALERFAEYNAGKSIKEIYIQFGGGFAAHGLRKIRGTGSAGAAKRPAADAGAKHAAADAGAKRPAADAGTKHAAAGAGTKRAAADAGAKHAALSRWA